MGSAVYYVNSNYGFQLSIIAAMKQFTYSFFLSGFLAKMAENITVSIKDKRKAIMTAVVSISLFTSIMVYILHSFKGTPEPFYSSIPTIVTSPFALFYVALKKRNKFDREQQLEVAEI